MLNFVMQNASEASLDYPSQNIAVMQQESLIHDDREILR